MAGLINLKLLADFFNKIGHSRHVDSAATSATTSTTDIALSARRAKTLS